MASTNIHGSVLWNLQEKCNPIEPSYHAPFMQGAKLFQPKYRIAMVSFAMSVIGMPPCHAAFSLLRTNVIVAALHGRRVCLCVCCKWMHTPAVTANPFTPPSLLACFLSTSLACLFFSAAGAPSNNRRRGYAGPLPSWPSAGRVFSGAAHHENRCSVVRRSIA